MEVHRLVIAEDKNISILLKEVSGKQYLYYWKDEYVYKPRNNNLH
jgi:hypothetical protein